MASICHLASAAIEPPEPLSRVGLLAALFCAKMADALQCPRIGHGLDLAFGHPVLAPRLGQLIQALARLAFGPVFRLPA
jgi:hypothetical protein